MTDTPADDPEAPRRARAAARSTRMIADVDPLTLTPLERMALVGELTRAAWAMTGRPWPDLPRSEWPVRIIRLEDK